MSWLSGYPAVSTTYIRYSGQISNQLPDICVNVLTRKLQFKEMLNIIYMYDFDNRIVKALVIIRIQLS